MGLKSEADGAYLAGKFSKATRYALDCIRFGQYVAQEGLINDRLIGHGYASHGINTLRRSRKDLSLADCQLLLRQLGTIRTRLESLGAMKQREYLWRRHAFPWTLWIQGYDLWNWKLQGWVSRYDQPTSHLDVEDHIWLAKFDLLRIEIALHAYRLKHGQYPATLQAIVSPDLPFLPPDPHTGRAFLYRHTKLGYDCYSTGPDGRDDGGVRAGWTMLRSLAHRTDLFLDTDDFPPDAVLDGPPEVATATSRASAQTRSASDPLPP